MRAGTRPNKWCWDDQHDPLQLPSHLHIRACAQDTAPTCRAHVPFFHLHATQRPDACTAAPQVAPPCIAAVQCVQHEQR
eukprot:10785750-Prorocentrum_lima.AAC.1